jgi:hypothetical protein
MNDPTPLSAFLTRLALSKDAAIAAWAKGLLRGDRAQKDAGRDVATSPARRTRTSTTPSRLDAEVPSR